MPRALWKGSISFGLVNIPVKMFGAVKRKEIRFNQIHAKDGARIRYKKFCAAEEKEVPAEEIVKGYEVSRDTYVTFTDEELEAADPVATHTIDIAEFVDLPAIDPVYFEAPYYLVPEKTAGKAYALLLHALRDKDSVAIGRFVFHTKEALVAIRAKGDVLVLSTMLFPDEVVPVEDLAEEVPEIPKPSPKELKMAEQLVEALTAEFEPDKYTDEHRKKLLKIIERKAAGKEIMVEPAEKPKKATDLMSALEASLKAAKKHKKAES